MVEIKNITITPEILKLIADIDEFKGRWKVIETLAPERLTSLRRIATIESCLLYTSQANKIVEFQKGLSPETESGKVAIG